MNFGYILDAVRTPRGRGRERRGSEGGTSRSGDDGDDGETVLAVGQGFGSASH